MHGLQVVHLKGENDRIKEKLRLAEKSAASVQLQMQKLYRQLDQSQSKGVKVQGIEGEGDDQAMQYEN